MSDAEHIVWSYDLSILKIIIMHFKYENFWIKHLVDAIGLHAGVFEKFV